MSQRSSRFGCHPHLRTAPWNLPAVGPRLLIRQAEISRLNFHYLPPGTRGMAVPAGSSVHTQPKASASVFK